MKEDSEPFLAAFGSFCLLKKVSQTKDANGWQGFILRLHDLAFLHFRRFGQVGYLVTVQTWQRTKSWRASCHFAIFPSLVNFDFCFILSLARCCSTGCIAQPAALLNRLHSETGCLGCFAGFNRLHSETGCIPPLGSLLAPWLHSSPLLPLAPFWRNAGSMLALGSAGSFSPLSSLLALLPFGSMLALAKCWLWLWLIGSPLWLIVPLAHSLSPLASPGSEPHSGTTWAPLGRSFCL